MQTLDFFRFYLYRSFRAHSALNVFAAIGFSLFAVSSSVFLVRERLLEKYRDQPVPQRIQSTAIPRKVIPTDLPYFHTTPFANAIERSAERVGVRMGEVAFSFDDVPTQSFLRYRANFTLVGRYPAMRDFVEQVGTTLRYISLDSMHCLREDIKAIDVSCAVTMSAIYRRAGHE